MYILKYIPFEIIIIIIIIIIVNDNGSKILHETALDKKFVTNAVKMRRPQLTTQDWKR
jgi:hypothetical protein